MPAYIILMKYTDQGIKDIKNAPARIEEGFKAWEAMGGKVLGYYLLMGEYDAMAIGEGPSDEIATAFAKTTSLQMRYKLDKKKRMLVRHPFQHVYLGISSLFLTNSSDMGTDPGV
ncbi:MAG: GYD domain-containing protein [Planctomycetota bacterium]|jgi:uncharacterized protein with GYD domain